MATKKEGVKCYDKAGINEELFVLRAQDETAGIVIMEWIIMNFNNPRMDDEKLEEAFQCAMRMRNQYNRPAD